MTAAETLPPALPQPLDEAVEAELLAPYQHEGRAEEAAMAACTMLALIGAGHLAPVGGPVAVAAAAAAFAPRFRKTREDVKRANEERRMRRAEGVEADVPEQVQHALDTELSARVLPGQPEDERVKAWQAWLPWSALRSGKHVPVPADLPHPSCAGFEFTRLASRVGQSCDWAASLPDGSRLHVHEYPGRRCEIHLDRLDPKQGAATAVIHYLSEAREGQVLFGLLAFGVLAGGIALVNRGNL